MHIFFIFFIIGLSLWWMSNRNKGYSRQFSILGSLGSLAKIALVLCAVYAVLWVVVVFGSMFLLHNAPGAFHATRTTPEQLRARNVGYGRECAQKFPIYRQHYNQQLSEHYLINNNKRLVSSNYSYDVPSGTCVFSFNTIDGDGKRHFLEMDSDYNTIRER